VILIAIRWVVGRPGLRSASASSKLAEAALYVRILASLVAFWIRAIAEVLQIAVTWIAKI